MAPVGIPPLKKNLFAQLYSKDGILIPRMENIIRCENLEIEATRWCERNGIPFCDVSEEKQNVTPIKDTYRDKNTPLQIYKLEQHWAEILETFRYHFGGIIGQ